MGQSSTMEDPFKATAPPSQSGAFARRRQRLAKYCSQGLAWQCFKSLLCKRRLRATLEPRRLKPLAFYNEERSQYYTAKAPLLPLESREGEGGKGEGRVSSLASSLSSSSSFVVHIVLLATLNFHSHFGRLMNISSDTSLKISCILNVQFRACLIKEREFTTCKNICMLCYPQSLVITRHVKLLVVLMTKPRRKPSLESSLSSYIFSPRLHVICLLGRRKKLVYLIILRRVFSPLLTFVLSLVLQNKGSQDARKDGLLLDQIALLHYLLLKQ